MDKNQPANAGDMGLVLELHTLTPEIVCSNYEAREFWDLALQKPKPLKCEAPATQQSSPSLPTTETQCAAKKTQYNNNNKIIKYLFILKSCSSRPW